jgi:hypothetical protein
MNAIIWILQVVLALHTVSGAFWKFANQPPELRAIPHGAWMAMGVVELLCGLALVLPAFKKSLGRFAPLAATFIALEMLLYVGLNVSSGHADSAHITYWLVVAAVCAIISYGRFVWRPIAVPPRKAAQLG